MVGFFFQPEARDYNGGSPGIYEQLPQNVHPRS